MWQDLTDSARRTSDCQSVRLLRFVIPEAKHALDYYFFGQIKLRLWLILLQIDDLLGYPVRRHHQHLQMIPNLDMPLRRPLVRISHQLLRRLPIQPPQPGYLAVQKRQHQTTRLARRAVRALLNTTRRVVVVHSPLTICIYTRDHGLKLVREEALFVEEGRDALRASPQADIAPMLVLVDGDDVLEFLLEGVTVGSEPDYGDHD